MIYIEYVLDFKFEHAGPGWIQLHNYRAREPFGMKQTNVWYILSIKIKPGKDSISSCLEWYKVSHSHWQGIWANMKAAL